ncbi:hypothetical protein FE257_006208 [Aspergillus nanangensis]|uniref:Uncharacterized protein n=1 Tax=Aspergillus nanangensis TaxID=2582783 RepID=A0AAD4GW96_ASPNN|nr:hypothetical protein FE257_006208 [Aspergillus nanangensis]
MHPNLSSSPPGLSLHTSFQQPPPHDRTCMDGYYYSTTSPLSSTTASSPTSTPSSPFRRLYRGGSSSRPISGPRSDTTSDDAGSRSQSPFRLSAVFRRPSLVLLRRRPSKVDMALIEERSRCDEDAIERQGLDLMEPRPVDPIGVRIPMDLNANVFSSVTGDRCSTQSQQSTSSSSRYLQPRFVMGGIFEVMEGRA